MQYQVRRLLAKIRPMANQNSTPLASRTGRRLRQSWQRDPDSRTQGRV